MGNNEEILRKRDEASRDRDEASRDREDIQADEREEQFAEREEQADERDAENVLAREAILSTRNVQLWATFVIIVMVAGLFYGTSQRTEAIREIQSAAVRIETAAVHTEEVLVEVVEGRNTPEAVAQAQRVREALAEIAQIRSLICSLPDLRDHPDCQSD